MFRMFQNVLYIVRSWASIALRKRTQLPLEKKVSKKQKQKQVDCVALRLASACSWGAPRTETGRLCFPSACFGMFVGGAAAQKSAAVIARQGAEKLGTEKVQVKKLYFHQWRLLTVLQLQKTEKAKEIAARAAEKEAKKAERQEVR